MNVPTIVTTQIRWYVSDLIIQCTTNLKILWFTNTMWYLTLSVCLNEFFTTYEAFPKEITPLWIVVIHKSIKTTEFIDINNNSGPEQIVRL